MKQALIIGGCSLLAACSSNPPAAEGKGFTIAAKADRSYGNCRVAIGSRNYRLNDDLGTLRDDMRARYGPRMHLWSTEVRLEALNFDAGDCGSRALTGLHRAGFVKFTLVPASQRAEAVAPAQPTPASRER